MNLFKKKATPTRTRKLDFKDLVTILSRPGTHSIKLSEKDFIPFVQYTNKIKLKKNLYYKVEKGDVHVSSKPFAAPLGKENQLQTT